MRPQRRKRSSRRLHPNIEAWLKDAPALPLPGDETLELLLDDNGRREKLWARFRPGEPYEDPINYLDRLEKGIIK